ncbi:response regulator [Methylococcus capsulatus]|jgi:two-component system response regulator CpxR|uniref:DNA-binding response regulator n=1 Tax=Methylococcus capsulatus (strain ATCC 33009 / NCIMB 11132 / Bath) TaxID=243233 RepID=Q605K3_METCA|nr:response regulator [Methylococcus capsulatus]AAU91704.1 DNA-binding response regulator [Methylococcus capsulatus str. Bath]QXP91515.1 response regulator [Methylococcus capsulatus]
MTRLLLIDDDTALCELLSEYLALEGYAVEAVHDGEAGLAAALSGRYRLALLDVTLPRLNGFEVLKRIRQESSLPVLMLTARGDDFDRVVGLEIGADDYLPKPFNHRELVARIKAILRRTDPDSRPASGARILEIDDLSINPANREVRRGGVPVELTAAEFLLLKTLAEAPGTLVGRDELTRIVLHRRLTPFDRAIDMHVSNLRRKLGEKPDGSPRIRTVRGSGYFYIGTPSGRGDGSA